MDLLVNLVSGLEVLLIQLSARLLKRLPLTQLSSRQKRYESILISGLRMKMLDSMDRLIVSYSFRV